MVITKQTSLYSNIDLEPASIFYSHLRKIVLSNLEDNTGFLNVWPGATNECKLNMMGTGI